jgi:hypothetical protein
MKKNSLIIFHTAASCNQQKVLCCVQKTRMKRSRGERCESLEECLLGERHFRPINSNSVYWEKSSLRKNLVVKKNQYK